MLSCIMLFKKYYHAIILVFLFSHFILKFCLKNLRSNQYCSLHGPAGRSRQARCMLLIDLRTPARWHARYRDVQTQLVLEHDMHSFFFYNMHS
jgi:hypothetical protein